MSLFFFEMSCFSLRCHCFSLRCHCFSLRCHCFSLRCLNVLLCSWRFLQHYHTRQWSWFIGTIGYFKQATECSFYPCIIKLTAATAAAVHTAAAGSGTSAILATAGSIRCRVNHFWAAGSIPTAASCTTAAAATANNSKSTATTPTATGTVSRCTPGKKTTTLNQLIIITSSYIAHFTITSQCTLH